MTATSLGLGLLLAASPCLADKIHLASGSVIEGKAQRVGDKVIVHVEAGTLTLRAAEVSRIEEGETELERVDARLRGLAPNDVHGLMQLADFCHGREMKALERDILRRVLAIDTDQPEARARLGYVRTNVGWVTEAEKRKAEGYVLYQGRWLTEEQLLATRKLEAETRTSELEHARAELALREKQENLAAQRADTQARKRAAEQERAQGESGPTVIGGFGYLGPVGYGVYALPRATPGQFPASRPGQPQPSPMTQPVPALSPTPGFRDPNNRSFQVPGYQNPRNYFR